MLCILLSSWFHLYGKRHKLAMMIEAEMHRSRHGIHWLPGAALQLFYQIISH